MQYIPVPGPLRGGRAQVVFTGFQPPPPRLEVKEKGWKIDEEVLYGVCVVSPHQTCQFLYTHPYIMTSSLAGQIWKEKIISPR